MTIQGQFRAILRWDRRKRWRESHWPNGQHRFVDGQKVEFTAAAFTTAHIGLAGVWEVKGTTLTEPVGPNKFVLHPQMVNLENYPFGNQVSGHWLQPAKK